jgi:hypothetical protein
MTTRREVEALEKLARAKVRSAEAEAKLYGVLAEALKTKNARNSGTDKSPARSGKSAIEPKKS